MSSIETELTKLKQNKYNTAERQFGKEEMAIKQTAETLNYLLSVNLSNASKKLLPKITQSSIEHMTNNGQLSVVAKNLAPNFLRTFESVVKKSNVQFEHNNKKIKIRDLYEKCRKELKSDMGREPEFGDILLNMYTVQSPFYLKLNSVLAGSKKHAISDDERTFAFLYNIAAHRAGLDKTEYELQTMPEKLYRGQTYGKENITAKFKTTMELFSDGKLASLEPEELAKINIVDTFSKKMLSTSSGTETAVEFAASGGDSGVVFHINNPAELGNFYSVKNISFDSREEEYISRIPDDVMMIPVGLREENGLTHVDVFCIRSEKLSLNNSSRFDELKNTLLSSLQEAIHNKPPIFNSKEITSLKHLEIIISKSSDDVENNEADTQIKFLQQSFQELSQLYQKTPKENKKELLDNLKLQLQQYSAAYANLNVVNERLDTVSQQQFDNKNIQSRVNGLVTWLKGLDEGIAGMIEQRFSESFKVFRDPKADTKDIQKASSDVLNALTTNENLNKAFPKLKPAIIEITNACVKVLPQNKEPDPTREQQKKSEIEPNNSFKSRFMDMKEQNNLNKVDALEPQTQSPTPR